VHTNHYLFYALETARERAAEADRHRLAAQARAAQAGLPAAVNPVRRAVARLAVAVARVADEAALRPAPRPH
jgi:hypothetical protein